MAFEDIVAVLERAFSLELKVVQETTVFEVASEDGGTKVQVLVQNVGERNLVLMSAELDRLAGIDFSKFDDKGVSEKYADKDLKHRYSDRMLLGEEFMLDDSKITCTSTYKLTVN